MSHWLIKNTFNAPFDRFHAYENLPHHSAHPPRHWFNTSSDKLIKYVTHNCLHIVQSSLFRMQRSYCSRDVL